MFMDLFVVTQQSTYCFIEVSSWKVKDKK